MTGGTHGQPNAVIEQIADPCTSITHPNRFLRPAKHSSASAVVLSLSNSIHECTHGMRELAFICDWEGQSVLDGPDKSAWV